MVFAARLALFNAGNSTDNNTAIIPMTTKSSTSVNARFDSRNMTISFSLNLEWEHCRRRVQQHIQPRQAVGEQHEMVDLRSIDLIVPHITEVSGTFQRNRLRCQ